MYEFNLAALKGYIAALPPALAATVWLSLLAIVCSLALGIVLALMRTSTNRLLRIVGGTYVEVLRNVPLLIIIYLFFFGLPAVGLRLSGWQTSFLALTFASAAYMAEIVRGGLAGVGPGQYEAARSQGMGAFQLYGYVVLPQVIRIAYAPFGNMCVAIVLGSSLASVVGVEEVTTWMHSAGSGSFRYLEAFTVAALAYVVLAQAINGLRIATGRWLLRHRNPGAPL